MNADPRPSRLEPRLEAIAGHLPAVERRKLAGVWRRWAEQLEATADAMDRGELAPGQPVPASGPDNLLAFPSPQD